MLKSRRRNSKRRCNMRVLKVNCPECGAKCIIKKTVWKDKTFSDVYLACSEVECGHTFVMNLTFSHTLSPSAKTGDSLLKALLGSLSGAQRQMALDLLQPAAV